MSFINSYTFNDVEFDFIFMWSASDANEGIILNPLKHDFESEGFKKALKAAIDFYPTFLAHCKVCNLVDILPTTPHELMKTLPSVDDDSLKTLLDAYEHLLGKEAIFSKGAQEIIASVYDEYRKRNLPKQPPEKKKQHGYVYILSSPYGFYKIGRTKNPNDRIRTFNVKLPFEVEYIHLIETDDYKGLERDLHSLFESKRVNGEWFDLTEKDIRYIKELEV